MFGAVIIQSEDLGCDGGARHPQVAAAPSSANMYTFIFCYAYDGRP